MFGLSLRTYRDRIGVGRFVLTIALSARALPAQETGALMLPVDKDEASHSWGFRPDQIRIVRDEATGKPAFEPASTPDPWVRTLPITLATKDDLRVPVVIEADVRLPVATRQLPPNRVSWASASLGWVWKKPDTGELARDTMELSRARFHDDYSYDVDLFHEGKRIAVRSITPAYPEVSPLMDDSVRALLERRTDTLPPAHERVHKLRFEVRRDSLRMFINGRFVGASSGSFDRGRVELRLNSHARLLNATARSLQDVPDRFFTVPLDDWLTVKGPAPPPRLASEHGHIASVEGIPFITSTGVHGEDALDVGQSVYLYRSGAGRAGEPSEGAREPEQMDVTRLTMRVPRRTWRRAWVLAGSDDDPTHVPVLTVRLYVPGTSWTVDATTQVPTYETTTSTQHAKRVAWEKAGGKIKSLWLLPIELDAAALAAQPMGALELTKAIHPYRSYPDPVYYGSYPAGLPSGVHVYGVTLEEAPVWARGTGTKTGNLYVDGETPTWRVLLKNLTDKRTGVDIDVKVTDPYGKSARYSRSVPLESDAREHEVTIHPVAALFGLYAVQTTIRSGDFVQTRDGTFLRLPPSHIRAKPDESPWGLWCWNGGHNTNPDTADNMRLLRAVGAINSFQIDSRLKPAEVPNSQYELRRKNDLGASQYRLVSRQLPDWSMKEPYDPAAYAAYVEEKGKEAREALAENPDLRYVNLFGENSISLRLTHGMPPWAMGRPGFQYDQKEQQLLRAHWLTAKAALEGVRKYAPKLKVLFGHCAPTFFEPFFKLPDWRNDMFDGFGLDMPQFERMPERQPRATEPSLLFFLHHEMQDMGMKGKEVVHLESYFPPSGPLSLSFSEQADNIVRTALLSLSMGTTKFLRTWTLFTSGDRWGASHYGSAGLFDRAPEFNPKPAAAAFATMTRVLDLAKYDGYVETGSRSAFCLRFKGADRLVYAVWTIQGTRALRLAFGAKPRAESVDMHGNEGQLNWVNEREASITLSPSPQWIVVQAGSIVSTAVGPPTYAAVPRPLHRVIDSLDEGWTYDPSAYGRYQDNNWDMPRERGEMSRDFVRSDVRRSSVLRIALLHPDSKKPMVGFYGMFQPSTPIALPGKPKAIGVWVNGHSAWNRIVYELVDAKGETWISCGMRDTWNSDDVLSLSSVNHDGWRYMSLPLPATAPGDDYREADTSSWSTDGDQVVDLPLRLKRIIVETRPEMVYVNDMLPIGDTSLELDDVTAEYESESDETDAPVKLQRAARNALAEGKSRPLPNPYEDLRKHGNGESPAITKVSPPDQANNGRRLFVEIKPVPGAVRYRGYVSAYEDGRGARALAIDEQSKHPVAASLKGQPNKIYFDGLQPDRPMYLFVTTIDKDGRESKPSAIRKVILKDEFPFK